MCSFREVMENGYHTYHYLDHSGLPHYLAFKRNGSFSMRKHNVLFIKKKISSLSNEAYSSRPHRHHSGEAHVCQERPGRRARKGPWGARKQGR